MTDLRRVDERPDADLAAVLRSHLEGPEPARFVARVRAGLPA